MLFHVSCAEKLEQSENTSLCSFPKIKNPLRQTEWNPQYPFLSTPPHYMPWKRVPAIPSALLSVPGASKRLDVNSINLNRECKLLSKSCSLFYLKNIWSCVTYQFLLSSLPKDATPKKAAWWIVILFWNLNHLINSLLSEAAVMELLTEVELNFPSA